MFPVCSDQDKNGPKKEKLANWWQGHVQPRLIVAHEEQRLAHEAQSNGRATVAEIAEKS